MCVCIICVSPLKKIQNVLSYELRKSSLSNLSINRIGLFGPT